MASQLFDFGGAKKMVMTKSPLCNIQKLPIAVYKDTYKMSQATASLAGMHQYNF